MVNKSAKLFRLVIYTSSGSAYANTIIEHIDRHNLIHERLYRKDLVKKDDKLFKDLTKLSKDMSRTLIVDSKADTCLQTENHVKIGTFLGDANDGELKRLYMYFKDKVSEMQHNVDLRSLTSEFNN